MSSSKIVMIGAGNLATRIALQLTEKGFKISQVYSRKEESAKELAQKVKTRKYTSDIEKVDRNANFYICALKDDVIAETLEQLKGIKGIIVHTAGSLDMSVFENKFERYGILYPLQTFSKDKPVDFSVIPIFIEANNVDTLQYLKIVASILSERVYDANSSQLKMLHLAAVFACNFVNHMYALADELIEKAGFDLDILYPLIDETAAKILELEPLKAQTGPAVRADKTTMKKHLELLESDALTKNIYQLLSDNICRRHNDVCE